MCPQPSEELSSSTYRPGSETTVLQPTVDATTGSDATPSGFEPKIDPYSNLRYVSLVPTMMAMQAPIATILDERLARIEAKLDLLLASREA